MFKFTTTTIINTAKAVDFNGETYVDSAGADVPKFKATDNDEFFVAGGGYFKKEGIQSVYKKTLFSKVLKKLQH